MAESQPIVTKAIGLTVEIHHDSSADEWATPDYEHVIVCLKVGSVTIFKDSRTLDNGRDRDQQIEDISADIFSSLWGINERFNNVTNEYEYDIPAHSYRASR